MIVCDIFDKISLCLAVKGEVIGFGPVSKRDKYENSCSEHASDLSGLISIMVIESEFNNYHIYPEPDPLTCRQFECRFKK